MLSSVLRTQSYCKAGYAQRSSLWYPGQQIDFLPKYCFSGMSLPMRLGWDGLWWEEKGRWWDHTIPFYCITTKQWPYVKRHPLPVPRKWWACVLSPSEPAASQRMPSAICKSGENLWSDIRSLTTPWNRTSNSSSIGQTYLGRQYKT